MVLGDGKARAGLCLPRAGRCAPLEEMFGTCCCCHSIAQRTRAVVRRGREGDEIAAPAEGIWLVDEEDVVVARRGGVIMEGIRHGITTLAGGYSGTGGGIVFN